MKIIRGFKVRGFILAVAFSAGLGFGTSASAQVTHSYLVDLNSKTVTDIGTLGGANSGARGINEAGQVAGCSYTAGGIPCFHHRPRWDGHERPWHLGRYLQQGLWHQRRRAGGG